MLTTVRSHDQFNTTVYTDEDRYRGVSGNRRVLLLAPEDMGERGIVTGTLLRIRSRFEDTTRSVDGFAALPYDVPRGTAVAYFPEANALIPVESFAEQSRTPTSKSLCIRVEPLPTPVGLERAESPRVARAANFSALSVARAAQQALLERRVGRLGPIGSLQEEGARKVGSSRFWARDFRSLARRVLTGHVSELEHVALVQIGLAFLNFRPVAPVARRGRRRFP